MHPGQLGGDEMTYTGESSVCGCIPASWAATEMTYTGESSESPNGLLMSSPALC